eukprot:GFUD01041116.1.p1 GENE.GFUD01041116.1~~GFUD01041116.1.p1  ORF type:complete len:267 (-),score=55.18 GFUD01041116.1:57-857(-)
MSLMSIDKEMKKWDVEHEIKYDVKVEDIFDQVHSQNVRPKSKKINVEEQNYYQCTECEYKSPSKRIIKTHKKKKHSERYQCDQCKYESNSKTGVDNHIEAKHGGICYICELCRYNTSKMKTFLNHRRTAHGKNSNKEVLKYPIPPKPVLSMKAEEIKSWFPSFFSKISFEIKAKRESGQPIPIWIKDIEDVISLSSLKMLASNWDDIEQGFFWKLKLVSAIVLDHKGFDYTDFAMKVTKKHMRYSVSDLKMMSKAKNPSTFENMFM